MNKNDFTKGKIPILILRLAIPMTVAQLVNVLYNVVDRAFIGHIPNNGDLALTGLGLCFPIITIIGAFANLVGMGGSPLFSIERGRNNNANAEEILGNSSIMLVGFGIIITILGLLFKKPILYMFGASDITYPYANNYIKIYLLGTTSVMIGLGLNVFINAQGYPVIGMLSTGIGCLVNVCLDYLFIFVFNLGVGGSAWATVVAESVSAIWILTFLTRKSTPIRLKRKCFRLDMRIVKRIVGLGMSGFVMSVTNGLVQIACNTTLYQFGGDLYVGVMTVLNSIREIVVMPVTGITEGGKPVLSYNYGAGEKKRVLSCIKFSTIVCLAYTFAAWILVIIYSRFFISIFNDTPSLIKAAIPALTAYFFGFCMMSFQFAGQSTFVGLGKAKHAVFFSIFRKVVIVVPLTLLLPRLGLGVMGVFWAEPISNLIGGLACYITMWRSVHKELA